jgi:hypothetical protein
MSDQPENITLRYLRRIDEAVSLIRDDMKEVKLRLTALETALGNLAATEISHYAITADRSDRVAARIERIETRRDLREPA